MSVMRSNLLGSLVANVRYNLNRKINRVRIFEIGAVFLRDPKTQDGPLTVAGYAQPKRVAALAYGQVAEEQWGLPARNVDYFDLKADLEAMFLPNMLRFVQIEHPALHPGRSAAVLLDDRHIGFIGELHPRWQQKYELPLAPVVFEVDATALQERKVPVYQEISKFPAVSRDLALLVKSHVSAQELLDAFAAEKAVNPLGRIVQAIVLFDEYRGKGLQNDEKSLAFRFTLQDTQTTLNDNNVDATMAVFIEAARKKCSAMLRT
jgi:phenylalanyl-tRNA synthetase beta chain